MRLKQLGCLLLLHHGHCLLLDHGHLVGVGLSLLAKFLLLLVDEMQCVLTLVEEQLLFRRCLLLMQLLRLLHCRMLLLRVTNVSLCLGPLLLLQKLLLLLRLLLLLHRRLLHKECKLLLRADCRWRDWRWSSRRLPLRSEARWLQPH